MALSRLARPIAFGLLAIAAGSPTAALQPEVEGSCTPTWDIVPSPNVGAGDNGLTHVAVVSPNDIWSVGNFTSGSSRKTVEVTLPDLTTLNRSGTTNSQGQTSVAVPKSQSGTYTFTVTSVAKTGFTYDPSANEETSDSVVVP